MLVLLLYVNLNLFVRTKNTYNSRLVYNIYYRNVCDKCGKVFYEHKVATNLKPGEVYTRFKIKV